MNEKKKKKSKRVFIFDNKRRVEKFHRGKVDGLKFARSSTHRKTFCIASVRLKSLVAMRQRRKRGMHIAGRISKSNQRAQIKIIISFLSVTLRKMGISNSVSSKGEEESRSQENFFATSITSMFVYPSSIFLRSLFS